MTKTKDKNPVPVADWPPQSPVTTGIATSCPRCGNGRLYAGLLTPAEQCAACGLDYSFIDSGDGPAVFVILILGFVIAGLAVMVEMTLSPPLWIHALIWIPLTITVAIWSLRITKAMMIAYQYKTSAREGEIQ